MFSDDVFLVCFGDGPNLVSGFFSTEDLKLQNFKQNLSFCLNDRRNQVFVVKFT